jgi:hypothetical protein
MPAVITGVLYSESFPSFKTAEKRVRVGRVRYSITMRKGSPVPVNAPEPAQPRRCGGSLKKKKAEKRKEIRRKKKT